ncbi:MAG TPA: GGDEF domain-containing protein, partial [Vicinamibacterales bacterium]|nr:GGDEF domain-containing protein [Vicinamibacterales bacterium]
MADDMAAAAAFATFGYLIGRKADELAKSAETDALTGLYNARGLETRLSTELERSARYQAPLSLLLIDLDRLKEINDRYGHYAGQTALRQVAAAIQAELRASDIGARWGGDEFAVAAPNTATGAAWAMAERIRTTISKAAMRWPLTASIGIATVDAAGLSSAVDIEILMRSADAALYDAKRQGRNRVAIGRTLTRVQAQRSDGHPFEPPDAPTPEPVVSH